MGSENEKKTTLKQPLLKTKQLDNHTDVFFFYEKDDYMTKKS